MNYTLQSLLGPRLPKERVWCANWIRCRTIGEPGYAGGGEPELCAACEADRLAREGENPQPPAEAESRV